VVARPVALGVVKPGFADGPIEGLAPGDGLVIVPAPAAPPTVPAACARAIEPASSAAERQSRKVGSHLCLLFLSISNPHIPNALVT
jgi:hypothetical protein